MKILERLFYSGIFFLMACSSPEEKPVMKGFDRIAPMVPADSTGDARYFVPGNYLFNDDSFFKIEKDYYIFISFNCTSGSWDSGGYKRQGDTLFLQPVENYPLPDDAKRNDFIGHKMVLDKYGFYLLDKNNEPSHMKYFKKQQ